MKKVIVLITVIVILALTAVACSKSSNPTSTIVDVIVTAPVTPSGPTPTPGTWDDNYPSADGNGNIYYTSNNAVTGSGIYCVKSDGTGTQKIESGAAYRGLEVSEDGQFLFVRNNAATVKRIILSNGNPQSTYILTTVSDIAGYGASWVSNTAKVLYNSNYGSYIGLTVEDTLGSGVTNITPGLLQNLGVICSSPFCKYETSGIVIYECFDGTIWHIIKEINAGTFTDITPGGSAKRYPAWSTDATKIVYCDNSDGDFDIYTMAADGTGKTKLFDTTANETYPRYIPGTNKIMFMSDKTGNNKLYTIDTNGNTTTIKMISR